LEKGFQGEKPFDAAGEEKHAMKLHQQLNQIHIMLNNQR
jgi:hypothetical protein